MKKATHCKDDADLMKLRRTVREFLRAIECVPMRAVDCDQDKVDKLTAELVKLSGFKGRR